MLTGVSRFVRSESKADVNSYQTSSSGHHCIKTGVVLRTIYLRRPIVNLFLARYPVEIAQG